MCYRVYTKVSMKPRLLQYFTQETAFHCFWIGKRVFFIPVVFPFRYVGQRDCFHSVYLLASKIVKNHSIDYYKICEKVALRPWKNPLDFVGDLDHVILGLGSVRVMVYVPCHTSRTVLWLGEDQVVPRSTTWFYPAIV